MRLSESKPIRYSHSSGYWPCIPQCIPIGHVSRWLRAVALASVLATVSNGTIINDEAIASSEPNTSDRLNSSVGVSLKVLPLRGSAQISASQELGSIQLAQALPATTYPVLAMGSTGETVSQLQATLRLLGFYQGAVDGSYSASTQAAVVRFQTATGLSADGITGPSTWRKLLPSPEDIAVEASQPSAATQTTDTTSVDTSPAADAGTTTESSPSDSPILRPNVEGSAVAQLQKELTQLGYYSGPIDGAYGELTQAAVREFQADQQLEADAIVGPSTWDALTRALN